jgi:hypothetical protein
VFYQHGRVYRGLSGEAAAEWRALAAAAFFRRRVADGSIVGTRDIEQTAEAGFPGWDTVLEHDRVPFVTYPYEWCFGMLQDAALLQLDLVLEALAEGLTMKDSTPFNVQWNGARPVFIDVASFVRRPTGEAWIGYRQFCELFLFPLLLQAYKDVPFHPWLRGSLDGIDAADCWRLMSAGDLRRPGVLSRVFLTSVMQRRYGGGQKDASRELKAAGFSTELISRNVTKLRGLVAGLRWSGASHWVDYVTTNTYDEADDAAKVAFVSEVLGLRRRALVWDVGCNTGRFSQLSAGHATQVVAMDGDHAAVERLYRSLKRDGPANILPMVFNVADPSPNQGWRGTERKSMEARDRPDLILSLALIHHLVITANLPLAEVIGWLAGLGAEVVIEFVGLDDPMVRQLLRNKQQKYDDYTVDNFERCLAEALDVARVAPLPSGRRRLYHAVPRR